MSRMRGRHTSTCKDGKKTIEWIRNLDGVRAVIIGKTKGRSGSGKVGHFKFQRSLEVAGFKGVMTCSYGLQELTVILESVECFDRVKQLVQEKYG